MNRKRPTHAKPKPVRPGVLARGLLWPLSVQAVVRLCGGPKNAAKVLGIDGRALAMHADGRALGICADSRRRYHAFGLTDWELPDDADVRNSIPKSAKLDILCVTAHPRGGRLEGGAKPGAAHEARLQAHEARLADWELTQRKQERLVREYMRGGMDMFAARVRACDEMERTD